jgi:benzoylformate decarboxylase
MDSMTRHRKRALIELLRAQGVEYVFGIPGATEIHFMDALEEAGDIRYILGLQEVVCAGMAEGYARATGRPAFLNLHTAPGLAAATPLLYNAQLGRVPLVITTGQNDSRLLQRDPHLSGDIVGIGRPFMKWGTEIAHAEDLPTTIQRAFKMAMQPPTGPVLVSLPQDVLEQEFDFAQSGGTPVYARLRPDTGAVRRAVEILSAAENPVVLVESGVARSQALDEVVEFAELVGARVYQNWMSDVNFPVSHPQYLGDLDLVTPLAHEVLARRRSHRHRLLAVRRGLFRSAAPSGPRSDHPYRRRPWNSENSDRAAPCKGDIKTVVAE